MRTKRALTILLSMILIVAVFAGCGPAAPPAAPTPPPPPAADTPPADAPPADAPPAIDFPRSSIDMTILFGAGGAADVVGRKLADLASQNLGVPIVANNRTGGGGAVGYQHVLSTRPDGYNICWNSTSINVVYHLGNMDENYAAFRAVAGITEELSGLAVRADETRFTTFEEFVAYAQANPGQLTVANSGVGSFNHLIAAGIESAAGIEVRHIPLDAQESITALLGGHVDAMVNMAFDVIQQVNAETMNALVVVGNERLPMLPDVPVLREFGHDFNLMMWRGITVPAETPDEVVAILEAAFLDAARNPEFSDFVTPFGVVVNPLTAVEFDRLMSEDDVVVANIIEALGIA